MSIPLKSLTLKLSAIALGLVLIGFAISFGSIYEQSIFWAGGILIWLAIFWEVVPSEYYRERSQLSWGFISVASWALLLQSTAQMSSLVPSFDQLQGLL